MGRTEKGSGHQIKWRERVTRVDIGGGVMEVEVEVELEVEVEGGLGW